MKRGDFVTLRLDEQQLDAMIVLASPNGDSLAVMFDGALRVGGGMLLGYAALLLKDGHYIDIVTNTPIDVQPKGDAS